MGVPSGRSALSGQGQPSLTSRGSQGPDSLRCRACVLWLPQEGPHTRLPALHLSLTKCPQTKHLPMKSRVY